jgi:hypothetical protein
MPGVPWRQVRARLVIPDRHDANDPVPDVRQQALPARE